MKQWINILLVMFFMGIAGSGMGQIAPKLYHVPDEYKTLQNPLPDDEEFVEIGKELYDQHCRSCHGKYGRGDGSRSEPDEYYGDFTSVDFQKQSDGECYFKTTWGWGDSSHDYTRKIPDEEERWMIVQFIRTLRDKN